ncbi:unnamed protein product [Mytilus coruscus]|uniref:Uncharacterized protein n=1 Tax=Mytilus coruscus TaxID=42192 RepID=A0A6J8BC87_MYTCO|nr:unnamed protein product [Mytilus coruscus]
MRSPTIIHITIPNKNKLNQYLECSIHSFLCCMDVADDYFNLLDYNEDDLDADITFKNQEMSQTFELEVAKQVVAKELENHDDSMEKIEFFFTTGGGMKCPIEGCTVGRFTSKCKFIRHWTERHAKTSIKYHCSIRNCTVTYRRGYDMKTHIKESTINSSSNAATYTTSTSALSSSTSSIPHFPSLIAATLNTSVGPEVPEYTVTVPSKNPSSSKSSSSSHIISLQDYRHREKGPSTPSVIRLVDCNTSFGIAATTTTDGSCQTTSLELQAIVLPPIPEANVYIRWLCLSIDQFSRQREAVKQKLEEVRKKKGTRFEQERKLRRDLEAENRKLKRELKENKWREHYLFPTEQ